MEFKSIKPETDEDKRILSLLQASESYVHYEYDPKWKEIEHKHKYASAFKAVFIALMLIDALLLFAFQIKETLIKSPRSYTGALTAS